MSTHVATQSTLLGGGGASGTVNITVSGTNPGLIVHVMTNGGPPAFQYPTAITWSLGGSLTKIKEQSNTADSQVPNVSSWALAAPAAGAGTVTVTFDIDSGSRDCILVAQVYSGVDQSTPCPSGDAVTDGGVSHASPFTLTPANLAPSDATSAACASSGGAMTGATPTQRFLDVSLAVEGAIAEASDTANVGFSGTGGLWPDNHAAVALRIKSTTSSLTSTPTVGAGTLTGLLAAPVTSFVKIPATP